MNPSNSAHITGNLAADPRIFTNSDGSASVRFTVITKGGVDGKTSRSVPLKAFVRADKDASKSIYAYMAKGDLVTVAAEIDTESWTDSNSGETKYETVLYVRNLDVHTTRAQREARQQRQAEAADNNAA